MAMAVTVVHDEVSVVIQVDDELFELAEELGLLGTGLSIEIQPSGTFASLMLFRGGTEAECGVDIGFRLILWLEDAT